LRLNVEFFGTDSRSSGEYHGSDTARPAVGGGHSSEVRHLDVMYYNIIHFDFLRLVRLAPWKAAPEAIQGMF
jgi:hypothetical protein